MNVINGNYFMNIVNETNNLKRWTEMPMTRVEKLTKLEINYKYGYGCYSCELLYRLSVKYYPPLPLL